MKKINLIFSALFISLVLHIIFFSLSIYIDTKSNPLIYSWTNVISKEDLFFDAKKFDFPPEVDFLSDKIRRDYFLPLYLQHTVESKVQADKSSDFLANHNVTDESLVFDKRKNWHFYLWKRRVPFPASEKETVSYKAYISPYGKVLVLYPEKLPFNSSGGLHLQDYIREASFFIGDKFFWTNLEGVVK